GAIAQHGAAAEPRAKAAIRLRLTTVGGMPFCALPLDSLTFFVKGIPGVAARIYEQIHSSCVGLRVRHATALAETRLAARAVEEVGFDDSAAMLPVTRSGFGGFRLLQEYFLLPERFMFFRLTGLGPAVAASRGQDLEITILLDRSEPLLENALDAGNFRLNCTPVINLFPKACGRIELNGRDVDYHILPDRNRPQDFEVYGVTEVTGIGRESAENFRIAPFYSASHRSAANEDRAYYTLQRRPRLTSMRQARTGERTTYLGSECFISVADTAQRFEGNATLHADIVALCTNRDLPMYATFGKGRTDFVLDTGAPVDCVRCVIKPTPPRPAAAWGRARGA
ncbi:MAG: type VI secretion system baseplate subunit TssF, partial [Sinobacteraceae bacterium]|nr:type VI secretion system baseplate subunit TssF [Nevskiaceae bacterium]